MSYILPITLSFRSVKCWFWKNRQSLLVGRSQDLRQSWLHNDLLFEIVIPSCRNGSFKRLERGGKGPIVVVSVVWYTSSVVVVGFDPDQVKLNGHLLPSLREGPGLWTMWKVKKQSLGPSVILENSYRWCIRFLFYSSPLSVPLFSPSLFCPLSLSVIHSVVFLLLEWRCLGQFPLLREISSKPEELSYPMVFTQNKTKQRNLQMNTHMLFTMIELNKVNYDGKPLDR